MQAWYDGYDGLYCSTRIVFWRHEIGIWGPERHHLYSDGVHLSESAMLRYSRSVGTSLMRVRRHLVSSVR